MKELAEHSVRWMRAWLLFVLQTVRCQGLPLFCSAAVALRKLWCRDFGYSIWEEVQDHKRHTAPTRYSPGDGEVCAAFGGNVTMSCDLKSEATMSALFEMLSSSVTWSCADCESLSPLLVPQRLWWLVLQAVEVLMAVQARKGVRLLSEPWWYHEWDEGVKEGNQAKCKAWKGK